MNASSIMRHDALWVLVLVLLSGCATLPEVKHKNYQFPEENAFVGDAKKPYTKLGGVKVKVNFETLDPSHEEADLCRNYYNKAVKDLVELAKDKGGDAVIGVRSMVFLEDGRSEVYKTPECSDDGMEGQILLQGIAIKYKPKAPPS